MVEQDALGDFYLVSLESKAPILWFPIGANTRNRLYLVTFIDILLLSVHYSLVPYVTSEFSQHGLLATTSIVATVLGGVVGLAVAKIIDIWGRVEGFAAMVLLIVVGSIMKATCTSVEMYSAAHVLYWVGHGGLVYVIDVMLADMTTLQNRMIMIGINGTPMIASTFAGPRIAELFLENVNFRWAFGAFCIILVGFCIPIGVIFYINQQKALRLGVAEKNKSSRTVWGSCKYYFWEFDGKLLSVNSSWKQILIFSYRHVFHHCWMVFAVAPIQSCKLCVQRLEDRVYHRDDYPRRSLSCGIRRVGAVLLTCPLFPLQVPP